MEFNRLLKTPQVDLNGMNLIGVWLLGATLAKSPIMSQGKMETEPEFLYIQNCLAKIRSVSERRAQGPCEQRLGLQ